MPGSKNNKNCGATLSYKIKKICRSGFTDPFMSEVPPKPGVLKIKLIHSHRLEPPEDIDWMIWSQELKKPVEEPSDDGSSSIDSKVIKEEIDSETELPNIYQLPLKRKSYHPLTRMGRPPHATHRARDTLETSHSITYKSDYQTSMDAFPTDPASEKFPYVPVSEGSSLVPVSEGSSHAPVSEGYSRVPVSEGHSHAPVSEGSSHVPVSAGSPLVPIPNSSEANKSESTSDQPPAVNVFIFQVNSGASPLIPNFEIKPRTIPIMPKPETIPQTTNCDIKSGTPNFALKKLPFGQKVLPPTFSYMSSQELNNTSLRGVKIPKMLYVNQSGTAPQNIAKTESSIPHPIFLTNRNAIAIAPKPDEFILPVISTVTSEKTGESMSGSFSTAFNTLDPNTTNTSDFSKTEDSKNKHQPAENSTLAKPIRNPKFEDLEIFKSTSNKSQDVSSLEIDGEHYIPKEMDSLDIYGLHVAERLRKLEQKTREFVQKSIDGLLFDAEIGLGDFPFEISQCSKSSLDSPSTLDEKSEIFDSESTWSALSDQA
ncbi:uncharacterized protein [Parasteatoda tepidariorum]|nr:uncharacterized protein LOC107446343 isoform X2 [Parasteatoda tepidariorum]